MASPPSPRTLPPPGRKLWTCRSGPLRSIDHTAPGFPPQPETVVVYRTPSEIVRLEAFELDGRKGIAGITSSPVDVFKTCSLPSLDNANAGLGAPKPVEPRIDPAELPGLLTGGAAAGIEREAGRRAAKFVGGVRAGTAVMLRSEE